MSNILLNIDIVKYNYTILVKYENGKKLITEKNVSLWFCVYAMPSQNRS